VALIDAVPLDFIEIYQYSPRPNTLAAEMSGQVSERIKRRRYNIFLKKVLARLRFNDLAN
jgi:tRNA A37 methylthiotransferase MiaB